MKLHWSADKPGSVAGRAAEAAATADGHLSRAEIALGLERSTREWWRAEQARSEAEAPLPLCLTLLRAGFTKPRESPRALVSSYLTVSPLPRNSIASNAIRSAVYSLWHFP